MFEKCSSWPIHSFSSTSAENHLRNVFSLARERSRLLAFFSSAITSPFARERRRRYRKTSLATGRSDEWRLYSFVTRAFDIQRRRRLRRQGFLDTKCARVNQCHFGDSRRHSTTGLREQWRKQVIIS